MTARFRAKQRGAFSRWGLTDLEINWQTFTRSCEGACKARIGEPIDVVRERNVV